MTDPLTQHLVLYVGSSTQQWEAIQGAVCALNCEAQRSTTSADALNVLGDNAFDCVVVASVLPDRSGLSFLARLANGWPDVQAVLALSAGGPNQSAEALNAGASEVIVDAADADECRLVLETCLKRAALAANAPPITPADSHGIAPQSPLMADVYDLVRRASAGTATVLLRGESGVGKEVVAREIHSQSPRANGPFVKVHCAALPEQILESELFGYEKGAFTGATNRKLGRVDLADGGSLFLDEIGDISQATQVKLLRIMQDREYERLGGTKTLTANVRFIAATHRDLERMVRKGEFREDLYYRLNVVPITIPPLRHRREDIVPLARHFCASFAEANGKSVEFSKEAIAHLENERWPGNVRQLQNFIERVVVLTENEKVSLAELRSEMERELGSLSSTDAPTEVSVIELGAAVRRAEKRAIEKALNKSGGDRTVAARILGISRRTLFYKLRDHQLN